MQHLAANFVLGYHGCDSTVAERLLEGEPFQTSQNDYDWLGSGIYFWEANPQRGLDFAIEAAKRKDRKISNPAVVGAVIDLGECLDLLSKAAIDMVRAAHLSLVDTLNKAGKPLPSNQDGLRRQLDCAVIQRLHTIYEEDGGAIDTVRGVFVEGEPVYPGSAFDEKTHIQIAVRNSECIKGVFRVPKAQLQRWKRR